MILTQYPRFVLTGAVVGVITVGAREVLARVLTDDTVANYSLSVVLAYAIGIVLSFLINRRFTFRQQGSGSWSRLPVFAGIAVIGLVSTWLLSLALRYGLDLDALFGKVAAPAAFAVAALCSSLITYRLTALLVFPRSQSVSGQRPDTAALPLE